LNAKASKRKKSWTSPLGLAKMKYSYMSLSLCVPKTVIGWALALALPSLAWADFTFTFTANGPEYAVAGAQAGDQVHPKAALSAVGGFLVWEDNAIDGYGSGIGASALDSNFGSVGRPFRVNQIVGGDQALPQVALLPGGGAVFTWQGGAPSRQNIYARFLSPTNTWLTGDVLVNTFAGNFKRQPALATLTNGNVVIVWGSFNQQGPESLQDVYGQVLTSAGGKVRSEFLVNQFTPYNQRSPAIAALSTGGFVIVWVSEQQTRAAPQSLDANFVYPTDGRPSVDVLARIFDSHGAAVGNEFLVNTNLNPCASPAVAAGPDGDFLVAWAEKSLDLSSNSWDVYARTFSKDGAGGNVRLVNTYTYGDQFAPQVASLGGTFLVVWTSLGQDGSWEGVYGQFLKQDGSPSGAEFRVNTTTVSRQMHPAVVSDNAERFLALWTSFAGVTSGFDLYAQRFAPVGFVASPSISSVFGPPGSDPFPVVLPPSANALTPVAAPGSNPSVADQTARLDPLPPLLLLSGSAPSNAIARAQGSYSGLIYHTNVAVASSGFFTAKTTAKGAYSGKLLLAGLGYSISGKFCPTNGLATNSIRLHSGLALTARLRLDLTGSDRLQGVIMDRQSYVAQLEADRLVFSQKTNPAPQRGSYTMAIPPANSGPAGYGYGTATLGAGDTPGGFWITSWAGYGHGTVTLAASGSLRWSATLADGTKVSQASSLSKEGLWPLYGSLYSGGGTVVSWMQFTNLPASDLNGQFIWIKPAGLTTRYYPAGLTNDVRAIGSAFTPPGSARLLNLTNGALIFSGGGLQNPFTNSFSLDRLNRATVTPGSGLKLTFSTSSGLFQGSARDPASRRTFSFQGVVYEKGANGAGLFLGPAQSGEVYLGAAPTSQ